MSMRDELSAAMDLAAKDDDTQDYEETQQEIDTYEAGEETEEKTGEEEEGLETSGEAPKSEDSDDSKTLGDASNSDIAAADDTTDKKQEKSGDSIKAPMDWGPAEREQWSKIPRNLQEKVMGREKELNTLMQNTADARRTHSDFEQLSNKYGSVLSGVIGATPMEAVGNLFNTVANLRMGSPIQKAQIIADLIGDFGVDVGTLDSALVGAAPTADQQHNAEIEAIIKERLAPFEAQMGQQHALSQQQETQRQDRAMSEVKQFSETDSGEFLNDVRHDMADFIDMASARGQDMTLKQAYDKAVAINPQIQSVLAQRVQHERLTGGKNSIAAKREAASSISGARVGVSGSESTTMRGALENAWDSQGKI